MQAMLFVSNEIGSCVKDYSEKTAGPTMAMDHENHDSLGYLRALVGCKIYRRCPWLRPPILRLRSLPMRVDSFDSLASTLVKVMNTDVMHFRYVDVAGMQRAGYKANELHLFRTHIWFSHLVQSQSATLRGCDPQP